MCDGVCGLDERGFACLFDIEAACRDAQWGSTLGRKAFHRVGAPLANRELQIFLQEWLARIPDFSSDPDDPPQLATGIVRGVERLALCW